MAYTDSHFGSPGSGWLKKIWIWKSEKSPGKVVYERQIYKLGKLVNSISLEK